MRPFFAVISLLPPAPGMEIGRRTSAIPWARELLRPGRLRRTGAGSAKKVGVKTEADIERLVHEARGVKG